MLCLCMPSGRREVAVLWAGGCVLGVRPPMSWGLSELAAARALAMVVRTVESSALRAGSGAGGGKGNMTEHMCGTTCVGGGCAVRPMGGIANANGGRAVSGMVLEHDARECDRVRVCDCTCVSARVGDSLELVYEYDDAFAVGETGSLTEASPSSLTVFPRSLR